MLSRHVLVECRIEVLFAQDADDESILIGHDDVKDSMGAIDSPTISRTYPINGLVELGSFPNLFEEGHESIGVRVSLLDSKSVETPEVELLEVLSSLLTEMMCHAFPWLGPKLLGRSWS